MTRSVERLALVTVVWWCCALVVADVFGRYMGATAETTDPVRRPPPGRGNPHAPLGEVLLAEQLLQKGQQAEAVSVCVRALEKFPVLPRCEIIRGSVLMRDGNTKEAVEVFSAARRLSPADASLRSAHGAAVFQLSQLELSSSCHRSLQLVNDAIALFPSLKQGSAVTVWKECARRAQMEGNSMQAASLLQMVYEVKPRDLSVAILYGVQLLYLRKVAAAAAALDAVPDDLAQNSLDWLWARSAVATAESKWHLASTLSHTLLSFNDLHHLCASPLMLHVGPVFEWNPKLRAVPSKTTNMPDVTLKECPRLFGSAIDSIASPVQVEGITGILLFTGGYFGEELELERLLLKAQLPVACGSGWGSLSHECGARESPHTFEAQRLPATACKHVFTVSVGTPVTGAFLWRPSISTSGWCDQYLASIQLISDQWAVSPDILRAKQVVLLPVPLYLPSSTVNAQDKAKWKGPTAAIFKYYIVCDPELLDEASIHSWMLLLQESTGTNLLFPTTSRQVSEALVAAAIEWAVSPQRVQVNCTIYEADLALAHVSASPRGLIECVTALVPVLTMTGHGGAFRQAASTLLAFGCRQCVWWDWHEMHAAALEVMRPLGSIFLSSIKQEFRKARQMTSSQQIGLIWFRSVRIWSEAPTHAGILPQRL